MRILGNILWIVFGGLLSALNWFLVGCLWCVTIVGIPVGLQCFKMASITLNPFGKEIIRDPGSGAFLLNVVWFVLTGWELALVNFLLQYQDLFVVRAHALIPPVKFSVFQVLRDIVWVQLLDDFVRSDG